MFENMYEKKIKPLYVITLITFDPFALTLILMKSYNNTCFTVYCELDTHTQASRESSLVRRTSYKERFPRKSHFARNEHS
eukprot:GAHX01007096.1.p1 GENE.GAHX01007096.1~~GAHX01007096.1.p1  ORF type:complete len:80 (-),score=3.71 GAHX01007096.1:26-265(-)